MLHIVLDTGETGQGTCMDCFLLGLLPLPAQNLQSISPEQPFLSMLAGGRGLFDAP